MKQIIKVESFINHKASLEEDGLKFFENRTDINIIGITASDYGLYYIIKQTSYQYYDFDKNEWVVLPNPEQPKIKGISVNDKEEGAE